MRIAFYNAWQPNATKLDKIISIFSLGMFSHVEMVFDNGEWFSISPREGEARFKYIHAKKQSWEFITLDLSAEDQQILYEKAKKYQGYKYDYIGAVFSIMPFCIQKESRLFCSEVVVTLLKELPEFSFLKEPCTYSPVDLFRELKNHRYPSTI